MRRYLTTIPILLVLASCAPAGLNPQDIQATADSLAATGVVLTLEALPSETQPPTATATKEPTATNAEAVQPTFTPTATGFAASGTQVNVGPTQVSATELANKKDNSTAVKLQNNTDQIIWLIIEGNGYWEYRFSDSFIILLPLGEYHYRAWIGEDGPYEGNFRIGNPDKHTFIFSNGKVVYQGP